MYKGIKIIQSLSPQDNNKSGNITNLKCTQTSIYN